MKRSERQQLIELANKSIEDNQKLRAISSRLLFELKDMLNKHPNDFIKSVVSDCEKELRIIYDRD